MLFIEFSIDFTGCSIESILESFDTGHMCVEYVATLKRYDDIYVHEKAQFEPKKLSDVSPLSALFDDLRG